MYTIPAAMFIESATDMIKDGSVPNDVIEKQTKELKFALGIDDASFEKGYNLGLQVARVLLLGNPKAVQNGIEI